MLHQSRLDKSRYKIMRYTLSKLFIFCHYLIVITVLLVPVLSIQKVDAKQPSEYDLKAVCIFNFMRYLEWPGNKLGDGDTVVIGVLGKDPFGPAWSQIAGKKVKGKIIEIRHFGDFDKLNPDTENFTDKRYADLYECQVLFVSTSEKKQLKRIFDLTKTDSILTIGESQRFTESGGIIEFEMDKNKVRFNINLDAAKLAGLQIKTTVLRLAKKVIRTKGAGN